MKTNDLTVDSDSFLHDTLSVNLVFFYNMKMNKIKII